MAGPRAAPARLEVVGVKYVFSWLQELDAPAERLAEEPGRDNKPVYLYRLRETGPRAWLAGRAVAEPDRALALERLAAPDFDVARQIVLPAVPQASAMRKPAPARSPGGRGRRSGST